MLLHFLLGNIIREWNGKNLNKSMSVFKGLKSLWQKLELFKCYKQVILSQPNKTLFIFKAEVTDTQTFNISHICLKSLFTYWPDETNSNCAVINFLT